jgi:hypothetical protein
MYSAIDFRPLYTFASPRNTWAPKLETTLITAFALEDVTPSGDGVQVDYLSYEGKPVRINFRFSPSGKMLHTRRSPAVRRSALQRV